MACVNRRDHTYNDVSARREPHELGVYEEGVVFGGVQVGSVDRWRYQLVLVHLRHVAHALGHRSFLRWQQTREEGEGVSAVEP